MYNPKNKRVRALVDKAEKHPSEKLCADLAKEIRWLCELLDGDTEEIIKRCTQIRDYRKEADVYRRRVFQLLDVAKPGFKLWQNRNKQPLTYPDLAELIKWLIVEARR